MLFLPYVKKVVALAKMLGLFICILSAAMTGFGVFVYVILVGQL